MLALKNDFLRLGKGYFEKAEGGVDVGELLDELVLKVQSHLDKPLFIVTKNVVVKEGKVLLVGFTIRSNKKSQLRGRNFKVSFKLQYNESFFYTFLSNLKSWLDRYVHQIELQRECGVLELFFAQVGLDVGTDFRVEFGEGTGILSISDNHIELGLSAANIKKIKGGGYCLEGDYTKSKNYKDVYELLDHCVLPHNLLKVKSDFTERWGIYSRAAVHTLIRMKVQRSFKHVSKGVGYYKEAGVFALIERLPIKSEKYKEYTAKGFKVIENKKMTKESKNRGLTRAAVRFLLTPYDVSTGLPVDLELTSVL